MKFVTVRDFRSSSARIWEQLKTEDEMVITSNGKPVALLTPLTAETLESTLRSIRKAKAMAAVGSMQLQSMQSGNNHLAAAEITREIAAVRKER